MTIIIIYIYVYRWILRNYPEVDRTWICSHIWQFQWVVLTCSSSICSRMTIVLYSYWNWQLISLLYCTHDQKGVGHLKFLTAIGSCEKKTSLTWNSGDCKNQIWIWEANQWHLNHNISQQMESHQQKHGYFGEQAPTYCGFKHPTSNFGYMYLSTAHRFFIGTDQDISNKRCGHYY